MGQLWDCNHTTERRWKVGTWTRAAACKQGGNAQVPWFWWTFFYFYSAKKLRDVMLNTNEWVETGCSSHTYVRTHTHKRTHGYGLYRYGTWLWIWWKMIPFSHCRILRPRSAFSLRTVHTVLLLLLVSRNVYTTRTFRSSELGLDYGDQLFSRRKRRRRWRRRLLSELILGTPFPCENCPWAPSP